jgi:hypothetical protein
LPKAEELAQGRDLGAMTDGERDELWEKAKKAL